MGCSAILDLSPAAPPGAHLSFYWTMDEGGGASKLDSTIGLAWPTKFGALAIAGLFSNGTHFTPHVVLNQNPGLGIFGTAAITINQAVSKGLSVWWWTKIVAYGTLGSAGIFRMDTSDPLHTNELRVRWGITDALNGFIEIEHTNDTDDVFVDTPNLTWALGGWHLIVGTFDKVAQTLNVYVDGTLSATIGDGFTYPDLTNTDMTIDDQSSAASAGESAVVDELGLCLNGALTPAQITALWNGGAGVTWPNITPIVPYP